MEAKKILCNTMASLFMACFKKIESEAPDVEKLIEDIIEKKVIPRVMEYIDTKLPAVKVDGVTIDMT